MYYISSSAYLHVLEPVMAVLLEVLEMVLLEVLEMAVAVTAHAHEAAHSVVEVVVEVVTVSASAGLLVLSMLAMVKMVLTDPSMSMY